MGEFIANGIHCCAINYNGLSLYFYRDAMKIVNECQKKSIKILGLDSFRITAQGIQPFQEFSFDYSNLKKTETWNAIKRDLNRLSESEFVFEITF